ncbi:MAG: hypothetical protein OEL84_09890 [Nitrosopumilus sp.]|nr:hypothetical protein [Nitrosopumilus sp.]MDH3341574.1 hypothetical protein [Nitrosopumilus sp.]
MSSFELSYLADKIHVHRWPKDSPDWDESTIEQLDKTINKNPEKKQIIVRDDIIQVENIKFYSIKKVGVTVPLFKDECTMIFEAKFGELFAHIHITIKKENYLEIFNQLISWRKKFFPSSEDSR